MTDRELMEAAAKAAGYELHFGFTDMMIRCNEPEHPDKTHNLWNPLTDDGDALRLAVKLRIRVHPLREAVEATWTFADKLRCINIGNNEGPCNGDPYAATRRAIVRAAAAMAPITVKDGPVTARVPADPDSGLPEDNYYKDNPA